MTLCKYVREQLNNQHPYLYKSWANLILTQSQELFNRFRQIAVYLGTLHSQFWNIVVFCIAYQLWVDYSNKNKIHAVKMTSIYTFRLFCVGVHILYIHDITYPTLNIFHFQHIYIYICICDCTCSEVDFIRAFWYNWVYFTSWRSFTEIDEEHGKWI